MQGCKSCTCSKNSLPHIPLLVEYILATANQGLVIDPVERLEHFLFHPLQKWGEKCRIKRIIILIEQIGLPFLPAEERKLMAVLSLQAATDQKLVIGVNKIIIGSRRDAEEKRIECTEATALAGLIGAIYNVQSRILRREINHAVGKRAECPEIEPFNPHDAPPAAAFFPSIAL